jgi:hypothetical protein
MRCEEQVSQRGTKEARLLKMRPEVPDALPRRPDLSVLRKGDRGR